MFGMGTGGTLRPLPPQWVNDVSRPHSFVRFGYKEKLSLLSQGLAHCTLTTVYEPRSIQSFPIGLIEST